MAAHDKRPSGAGEPGGCLKLLAPAAVAVALLVKLVHR